MAGAGAWQAIGRAVASEDNANRFAGEGRERPGFLVLFTDDHAFQTINALNNPDVKTRNTARQLEEPLRRNARRALAAG